MWSLLRVVIVSVAWSGHVLRVEGNNNTIYVPPQERRDICDHQRFQARCGQDEVINITWAKYGQLGVGSCRGSSGGSCLYDVLGLTDTDCSGKQQCQVGITNQRFDSVNDCLAGIRPYYSVSYDCVPVHPLRSVCADVSPRIDVTSDTTLISSFYLTQYGCLGKPLTLQASAGQQILIWVSDFAWKVMPSDPPIPCDMTNGITDKQAPRTVSLCGGQGQRVRKVMVTIGNTAILNLPRGYTGSYVLKVQALGCADISVHNNMWTSRHHNNLTVGCQDDSRQWSLLCVNARWQGTFGNCTPAGQVDDKDSSNDSTSSALPNSILITIIASVALLVSILVATVGVVCYKKSSVKEEFYATTLQMQYDTIRRTQQLHAPINQQQLSLSASPQQLPHVNTLPTHTFNGTYQPHTPITPPGAEYVVPPFSRTQPRRQSSRDCTYESIHIMDRPIPSGETASGLKQPPLDLLLAERGMEQISEAPSNEQDRGNKGRASVKDNDSCSSDDESADALPKYFVLDADVVKQRLMDQSLSDE